MLVLRRERAAVAAASPELLSTTLLRSAAPRQERFTLRAVVARLVQSDRLLALTTTAASMRTESPRRRASGRLQNVADRAASSRSTPLKLRGVRFNCDRRGHVSPD
jgi:hypothetical protein